MQTLFIDAILIILKHRFMELVIIYFVLSLVALFFIIQLISISIYSTTLQSYFFHLTYVSLHLSNLYNENSCSVSFLLISGPSLAIQMYRDWRSGFA